MRAFLALLAGLWATAATATEANTLSVQVNYLRVERPAPPTLSNLEPIPDDLGIAGAQLGLADNTTTGSFLGQTYALDVVSVPEGESPLEAARSALAASPYLVLDAPAEALTAIADMPEAQGALLFNATAEDNSLRSEGCRANLLHTAASLSMRSDALMQFFASRRWATLALVEGPRPEDAAFAAALRASATKFGLRIEAEKSWAFDADMRRNASAEVPLFTQELGEHDALLVADETHDFGRYIAFNTWLPRPVAGSEGLVPLAWSPVIEQWGAAQLQSRFTEAAGRPMASEDYAAWAAIRTLGEAVTRTGSADPATLRSYVLGDNFELAGFKGRPMSFRPWNGQLRQPIALAQPRALVASAPLEGFLHQVNELDTLGIDAPESACTAFGE
ncbi:ABC transporter substrate-binding protein [Vannielia litorea]|uniref:ABC transporter substrate-binding protein n=1 Tax=Vannielia litorea TaxID=1217970 RepID=UPI001BD14124|nr:ABC transporter substrate-binding protein [Vannielia litorea]MBS8225136.1 branched-chain amino acid ABC transporter substrate-binding protein [Vannielia litorea]